MKRDRTLEFLRELNKIAQDLGKPNEMRLKAAELGLALMTEKNIDPQTSGLILLGSFKQMKEKENKNYGRN